MDINELAMKYYQILDNYDPTGAWVNETTVEECKNDIKKYPYLVIEKLVNIITDIKKG